MFNQLSLALRKICVQRLVTSLGHAPVEPLFTKTFTPTECFSMTAGFDIFIVNPGVRGECFYELAR